MSIARIFKPTKSAMQSGKAHNFWYLAFPSDDKSIDNIMGWTGSSDMRSSEVKLKFESKEEAVAYAKRNNIECVVIEPKAKNIVKKVYANNFKWPN